MQRKEAAEDVTDTIYPLGVVWVCSGLRNSVLNLLFLRNGTFKRWKGGAYWEAIRLLSLAAIRVALCPWVIIAIRRGSGVFLLKCRISGSLCRFVNYYMMKRYILCWEKQFPVQSCLCGEGGGGILVWPWEQWSFLRLLLALLRKNFLPRVVSLVPEVP